jgi:hypothetical protein
MRVDPHPVGGGSASSHGRFVGSNRARRATLRGGLQDAYVPREQLVAAQRKRCVVDYRDADDAVWHRAHNRPQYYISAAW